MSGGRGRPVMLTQGERRLLVEACEKAIESLEVCVGPRGPLPVGPVREAIRVLSLRIRQYRRLIRELANPGPAVESPADSQEGV